MEERTALLRSTANLLRGMTFDPAIPKHAKEVLEARVERLDKAAEIVPEKSIELRITEAASDYKMALTNSGFADEHGGVNALKKSLFDLVEGWEWG